MRKELGHLRVAALRGGGLGSCRLGGLLEILIAQQIAPIQCEVQIDLHTVLSHCNV